MRGSKRKQTKGIDRHGVSPRQRPLCTVGVNSADTLVTNRKPALCLRLCKVSCANFLQDRSEKTMDLPIGVANSEEQFSLEGNLSPHPKGKVTK